MTLTDKMLQYKNYNYDVSSYEIDEEDKDTSCLLNPEFWIPVFATFWVLISLVAFIVGHTWLALAAAFVVLMMALPKILPQNHLVRSLNYFVQIFLFICLSLIIACTALVIYIDESWF